MTNSEKQALSERIAALAEAASWTDSAQTSPSEVAITWSTNTPYP